MTTLSGVGRPASRSLIHADDPGQANRLALLVSHYGHQPGILDTRQLLTPMEQGTPCSSAADSSARRVRLGLSLWPGLPRPLVPERLETQLALLRQGVLLVPHPCGERGRWSSGCAWPAASSPWCRPDADRGELRQELEEAARREQAKGAADAPSGLDEEQAYRLMRSTAMSVT